MSNIYHEKSKCNTPSSQTGSQCSRGPTASDRAITWPAWSTPRYFPYPDLNATLREPAGTAVSISSGAGPSDPRGGPRANKPLSNAAIYAPPHSIATQPFKSSSSSTRHHPPWLAASRSTLRTFFASSLFELFLCFLFLALKWKCQFKIYMIYILKEIILQLN